MEGAATTKFQDWTLGNTNKAIDMKNEEMIGKNDPFKKEGDMRQEKAEKAGVSHVICYELHVRVRVRVR